MVVEELANQHAQNESLNLIDEVLADITLMDRHTLLDKLGAIPMKLEETIATSNNVYSARDYKPFASDEDAALIRFDCGISDEWDRESGGYYLQDYVLLGGKRGSGKSIVCANLIRAQHDQGNVSIYCTIEMTYSEVMGRILSAISHVPYLAIKMNDTTKQQDYLLAATYASLFVGGDEVLAKHFADPEKADKLAFQNEVASTCVEKDEGRIIILDDRDLTLSCIDTKLATYKARYGDMLKLVVVDYVNQVVLEPGADMYDWKNQISLSKGMKNLARKYNICLVSPYQMDDSGQARFAKGLLDSPDVAQLIHVDDKDSSSIVFETTKARSASDTGVHRVGIHWETLRIDPRPVILEEMDGSADASESKAKAEKNIGEGARELQF